MTVRHWLAARLQDKLQNPRQAKDVPRVECPQDAAERRKAIAAVFPNTALYDSEEEVADLVTQGSTDATKEVTQSQSHEEDTLRRESTRKRKPSARAIDSEQLQLSCTDSPSQADQRKCFHEEATEAPLLAHPKPPVAPSPSSNQRSDTHKLDTAVPWAAPVAPSPLERKRRVKYVKPSRTALKTRKKPTRLLPTPASSIVVSQVPSRCLHGSPNGLNSDPMQDLEELHTGHDASTGSCELARPTENIVSQNHCLPDSDSHMTGVNQRHTGFFVPPQKHSGHSIDTAIDVRDRDDKGGWGTRCSYCRRAAPPPLACVHHGGDDPFNDKSNAITFKISTSRDISGLMKRNISKPLVSSRGQSTAPKRVLEVPRPNEAMHDRRYDHEAEPKVVQWSHHASDRKPDRVAGAATQRVDYLDVNFALLGDPSADDL
jgi:hypothetical protein